MRLKSLAMKWRGAARAPEGFVPGKYGIPEPGREFGKAGEELYPQMIWLVPGVAFDGKCRRLGRGKGVYDRLLGGGKGFSIGVFYERQKCAEIPSEPHDRELDAIVTEERIYRNSKAMEQNKLLNFQQ